MQRIDLCLPPPNGERWVEGVVRDHLTQDDAPVFYVENALINALFGLLCWRAIFAAIPGAFFHPFHRGPADLYSADFYRRRRPSFPPAWTSSITAPTATPSAPPTRDKAGIQSPFVLWDGISLELVELALDCIPAAHLRKWCERILPDIKRQPHRLSRPDPVLAGRTALPR